MANRGGALSSPVAFIPPQLSSARRPGHSRVQSSDRKTPHNEPPLEDHLENLRIVEALLARDHAIYRMESICASLRDKEVLIAQLQQEKAQLEAKLAAYTPGTEDGEQPGYVAEIERLYELNAKLTAEIEDLRLRQEAVVITAEKENPSKHDPEYPVDILSPVSRQNVLSVTEDQEKPETIIQGRYAVLAELPLPPDMPSDMLVPIVIPTPYTIHDFLSTVVGPYKVQLTNYRVFQESTTSWCPEREEHGYYLTPFYKCNTNPRVATAHRWAPVDLVARVNKPAECFYNKEGKWYYAGVYKSFRLRDITPQEWVQLPVETTQALIKETLAGRKNTSPQNIYETGQLYAAGALKAACIGLQCIGFDEKLYRALLTQAEVCVKTGRWRGTMNGLGTGAMWNVSANTGISPTSDEESEKNAKA